MHPAMPISTTLDGFHFLVRYPHRGYHTSYLTATAKDILLPSMLEHVSLRSALFSVQTLLYLFSDTGTSYFVAKPITHDR